jgi:hypothetical protein
MDGEALLVVVNSHGYEIRGADIVVDSNLNPPKSYLNTSDSFMTMVLSTAQIVGMGAQISPKNLSGAIYPFRSKEGTAYVKVKDFPPSEVLVLANHPLVEEGFIRPD